MRTSRRRLLALPIAVALVLTACGEDDTPLGEPDPADPGIDEPTDDPTDDPVTGDEPADDPEEPMADGFDREQEIAEAEALLGTPEDDVEEDQDTRITRRGDEEFMVTMDLQPGRQNLELDEQDGTYVVTRVVVEVPDGEDPIDVS